MIPLKKVALTLLIFMMISLAFAKSKKKMLVMNDEDMKKAAEAEENWQYLEWTDHYFENVRRYGVEVQFFDKKKNEWVEQLLENDEGELVSYLELKDHSTKTKIKPSLPPGEYRYRITPYDLLDRKSTPTDWIELDIIEAFEPDVKSLSPSKIYLDEYNDGFVKVSGKNLFLPKSLVENGRSTEYTLKAGPLKTFDIQFIDPEKNYKIDKKNDSEFIFYVDPDVIPPGKYNLLATDESGLVNKKNSGSEFEVRFKKRVDLDVSLGYTCPFIAYDNTFDKYMDSRWWPLSATARITFIPFKRKWGYLGLGVCGTYTRMQAKFDSYKIDGNLATAHLDLVYQKVLNKKMTVQDPLDPDKTTIRYKHFGTLEAHVGAGATYFMKYQFHFEHDVESEELNGINISANAGASFQWYLTKRLYTEANVDFVAAFMRKMTYGMIVPSISVGWQF